MADSNAVVLTVAQNRFLLNATGGEGYLYMRLTTDEASEVRGRTATAKRFTGCIQSQPCVMEIERGAGGAAEESGFAISGSVFTCPTHGTKFVSANDPDSFLWPRVEDGLRLYDCELKSVTVFRLSMTVQRRFVTELSELGTNPPVFGALLGDAANAIHFWPGRGLNHGIYSAVALARSLHRAVASRRPRPGAPPLVRAADLARFEAALSALQLRHKDRAWRAMVQRAPRKDGKPGGEGRAVRDVIYDAVMDSDGADRAELLEKMEARVRDYAERLEKRLPVRPVVDDIVHQLEKCSDETLNVMVRSGP